MAIDTSWEKNKKSLIGVITGFSILFAVNILNLGIIGGFVVGGIIGALFYYIFDRLLPKKKKEMQETTEKTKQ